MTKLLVMTDLHLTPGAERIIGMDPLERFLTSLRHASRHHPDAERLVITGDLTHYGDAESYQKLGDAVADCPWPISFLLGNHDKRAAFRTAFPTCPVDQNGFVQSVIDLGTLALLTLDTLDEEGVVTTHGGYLCQYRLDWLTKELERLNGKPCLLFLHHPPFRTGFSGMDAIRLLNDDAFLKRVSGSSVTHIFAGHIHRNITSSVADIPVTVFKSTFHQMPMLLGKDGSHHSVDEPSAYGIILVTDGSVVVHFEDVLEAT